jgi:hypothetical protein
LYVETGKVYHSNLLIVGQQMDMIFPAQNEGRGKWISRMLLRKTISRGVMEEKYCMIYS